MGECPSGQRERTVNAPALPALVQIQLPPPETGSTFRQAKGVSFLIEGRFLYSDFCILNTTGNKETIQEVPIMMKIGFCSEDLIENTNPIEETKAPRSASPRKSVVQVAFPNGRSYAYYNDKFDLNCGDYVYVDGKLEGIRGQVTEVNYSFKIKLSDYKRVISLIDTEVHGEFFGAGSHFITFDPAAIPAEKVRTWFLAPVKDEDEYACGDDDSASAIRELFESIPNDIGQRGFDYFKNNHVVYLSLYGSHGYAIVQGTEAYEVEFEYNDGMISALTCSCFCSYNCKHEVAALIQLEELTEIIEKEYRDKFDRSHCFAAILKSTLFAAAADQKGRSVLKL